jgi:hypothetical protein
MREWRSGGVAGTCCCVEDFNPSQRDTDSDGLGTPVTRNLAPLSGRGMWACSKTPLWGSIAMGAPFVRESASCLYEVSVLGFRSMPP